MIKGPRRRLATAGIFCLAFTAACGGGDGDDAAAPVAEAEGEAGAGGLEELVAAAQEEGTLTFYSSTAQDQIDVLTGAFTEEYGIEVEVLRLNSGELAQRFSAEADAGSVVADVFSYASPELFEARPEWFLNLDEADVPEYAEWPDNAKGEAWVAISLFPYSVSYNTDLVPEGDVPEAWTDLVEAEWEGRILLTDPRTSPSYIGWADAVEKEFGPEFLQQLGSMNPPLVQSASPGAQQVAAGAYAANFPSMPVHPVPLINSGAPIDYAVISDPPIAISINTGISEAAPNPNAAKLFFAWQLTEAGQTAWCSQGTVASPVSLEGEIEGCIPLPSDWHLVEYGLSDARQGELLDLMGIGG